MECGMKFDYNRSETGSALHNLIHLICNRYMLVNQYREISEWCLLVIFFIFLLINWVLIRVGFYDKSYLTGNEVQDVLTVFVLLKFAELFNLLNVLCFTHEDSIQQRLQHSFRGDRPNICYRHLFLHHLQGRVFEHVMAHMGREKATNDFIRFILSAYSPSQEWNLDI